MAWEDFEDTTEHSRRPQLTRQVGAPVQDTKATQDNGFNWTYVWVAIVLVIVVAVTVILTLYITRHKAKKT